MELDERKKRILQAIIDAYIDTAEPVGSRTLSKMQNLSFSPATIRNEMSDLEEMGYLGHPHTSAGRIPSQLGYRFYVDSLMERYRLSMQEMEHINQALRSQVTELEKMINHASRIISELTNYTAIVSSPKFKISVIKKIEIVPVDDHVFLMVLILSDNVVKNKLFRSGEQISPSIMTMFSSLLNATLVNRALGEITWDHILSLQRLMPEYNDIIEPVLRFAAESIEEFQSEDIHLHGVRRILDQPEFHSISKAKEFLDILEDRSYIQKIVSSLGMGQGTKIIIGKENTGLPFSDSSIVICQYSTGENTGGTIGIIGPTRMDYSKIVSSLEYFAKVMGRMLVGEETFHKTDDKKDGGNRIE